MNFEIASLHSQRYAMREFSRSEYWGDKISGKFTHSTRHCIFRTTTIRTLVLQRFIVSLALAIGTGLLIILTSFQSSAIFVTSSSSPLKPHPLPPTLTKWQDNTNSGDYFSQVNPTQVGYLVWSQFPVRVYVERPEAINSKQAEQWVNTVLQAVQEWSVYLPLAIAQQPKEADITIVRKTPPLQTSPNSKRPRARSAQTTYELYVSKNNLLSHRFTMLLSPSQTGQYLLAATRHELGHALGIWGHSPLPTDALYFSQVRNSPSISPRDVNTLKRVYEQPTSLGWPQS
ncbi:peptidase [Brasilonema sp. UFV-L1]|uniref:peptidase n=2 Tax=Brasilonema sp. UFV-L1 TaxID=2234130 RepID=UPI002006E9FF|nr:peptidase [Brasilonema sp. UFV-L1]